MATSVANVSHLSVPRWSHRSSLISSAHTSPSTYSINSNAERPLVISSLHGSYVSIMVQVTRDLHPVVYPNLLLPEPNFELAVADVTLAQYEALARREGKQLEVTGRPPTTGWPTLIKRSMLSLAQLLKVCRHILAARSRLYLSGYRIRFCPSTWVSASIWPTLQKRGVPYRLDTWQVSTCSSIRSYGPFTIRRPRLIIPWIVEGSFSLPSLLTYALP